MPKWLIIALLLAASVPVGAQARGGFGFGRFRNPGLSGHPQRGFGRSLVYFGDPFLDADYASRTYEPSTPPVVILQPPATAAASPEPKTEPLMIEWKGDRYVRLSGQPQSNLPLDYSQASSVRVQAQAPHGELPPAILVFRDGHLEEVSDYVIANGSLYARGDYYRDGFWTKTVHLSSLDIPATILANSESTVKFRLPSGPDEIVTRP